MLQATELTIRLHPNDDESSPPIDLTAFFPGGLRFFDRTHTTVYVNTNGNVSFSAALSAARCFARSAWSRNSSRSRSYSRRSLMSWFVSLRIAIFSPR